MSDLPELSELSASLAAFVGESPEARMPHVSFLRDALVHVTPGARLLDVGAGDMPYRELFADFEYLSHDWEGTLHTPNRDYDVVSPADQLPLGDASIDVVVCTQVLEHLPEPWLAVEEFHRILVPGGRLILTAPLVWPLHELPYDYYRFTSYGLGHLIDRAGFASREISAMNDAPGTVAALLREMRWLLGHADDGFDAHRAAAGDLVGHLSQALASIGWLDTLRLMPISFSAVAVKAIEEDTP